MGTPIFLDSGAKRDCPCETRKSHVHTLFTTAKAATMLKLKWAQPPQSWLEALKMKSLTCWTRVSLNPTKVEPAAACGDLSEATVALSTAPASQDLEQIEMF